MQDSDEPIKIPDQTKSVYIGYFRNVSSALDSARLLGDDDEFLGILNKVFYDLNTIVKGDEHE